LLALSGYGTAMVTGAPAITVALPVLSTPNYQPTTVAECEALT